MLNSVMWWQTFMWSRILDTILPHSGHTYLLWLWTRSTCSLTSHFLLKALPHWGHGYFLAFVWIWLMCVDTFLNQPWKLELYVQNLQSFELIILKLTWHCGHWDFLWRWTASKCALMAASFLERKWINASLSNDDNHIKSPTWTFSCSLAQDRACHSEWCCHRYERTWCGSLGTWTPWRRCDTPPWASPRAQSRLKSF